MTHACLTADSSEPPGGCVGLQIARLHRAAPPVSDSGGLGCGRELPLSPVCAHVLVQPPALRTTALQPYGAQGSSAGPRKAFQKRHSVSREDEEALGRRRGVEECHPQRALHEQDQAAGSKARSGNAFVSCAWSSGDPGMGTGWGVTRGSQKLGSALA